MWPWNTQPNKNCRTSSVWKSLPPSGIIASSLCTSDEPIRAVLTSERPNRRACPRQVSKYHVTSKRCIIHSVSGNASAMYSWVLHKGISVRRWHKVHIYQEYYNVCPLVRIGTHHPHLPQASVPPPEPQGVGIHSPAGEGVGESQFGRLEKKPSTLSTLCRRLSQIRGYPKVLCGREGYLESCVGMNNCTKCEIHRDKGNEKGGGGGLVVW